MSEPQSQYWQECIAESLDQHGVKATAEQINLIAADIESSHDHYGMAFYQPAGPSQAERDLMEVREKLRVEQSKITCRQCNGTGSTTTYGGTMQCTSQCWKCHGEGRYV